MSSGGEEGRRQERVDVRLHTVYHDEINADESDSLMSNLSSGGCFITTSRPLSQGSRINVRFRLDTLGTNIEASGIVRWVKPGDGGGMGIQFDSISEEDLISLKRFVAEKLESELFA